MSAFVRRLDVRRSVLGALMAIALSTAAHAAGGDERNSPDHSSLFAGIVQEQDVGLLFDYLREALSAALNGREVLPSERLVERGEIIAEEAKRRGEVLGRELLDRIERSIRESMRPDSALQSPRRPPN